MQVTPFHLFRDISRYLKHDLRREFYGWLRLTIYYAGILTAAAILTAWIVASTKPFPPKNIVIAEGQLGSAYQQTAQTIKDNLNKLGFHALLTSTSGQIAGFEKLASDTDSVAVSLLTAGTFSEKAAPNVRSLGSIGFSPIWFFYRGDAMENTDPFAWAKGKRISIGPDGSVTNRIYRTIVRLSMADSTRDIKEIATPNANAADQLMRGEIDGAFMVDALESPTVQRLIRSNDIQLFSFHYADAYTKQLPFLQKLTIPAGSFDLKEKRPQKAIELIASPIDLLVTDDTHPALQWALLMSVQKLSLNENNFFSQANTLPRYLDKSFPLSEVAERYYKSGIPSLFFYLPVSLASLIDHIWIYMIGFVLIVKPLLNKVLKMRSFNSDMHLDYYTRKVRALDLMLETANDRHELEYITRQLTKLQTSIDQTWFDESDIRSSFGLESTISRLKKTAEDKLQKIISKEPVA